MPGTTDSILELLAGRRHATLATVNDDGTVHLTPVWYLFENDRFYIGSGSTSRKARNVMKRPNASVMIDVRRPGTERWVYGSGKVEILRGDEAREITTKILPRYLTREALDDPRIGPAFTAVDDIVICIVPDTWRSWNSKDVDEQFFGGILTSAPERWFRPVDG